MEDNRKQQNQSRWGNQDELTGTGKGPQGVDKAPGEETSRDTEQVKVETQKGKKVDADPSKESGRPVKQ